VKKKQKGKRIFSVRIAAGNFQLIQNSVWDAENRSNKIRQTPYI